MPDLTAAQHDLLQALGDDLARERPDGVFHLAVGGPGSVPGLHDLDRPELHLEALPDPITDGQRAALGALGYTAVDAQTWTHPGGWRLVLPDLGSGWRAQQAALRHLLRTDADAARTYRQVFLSAGRQAADAALQERSLAHHAAVIGWKPVQFAAQALAPLAHPWMFAAGAALDLHLGRVARLHDDLDVAVSRAAQQDVLDLLRAGGWRLDTPADGAYHAWTQPLEPPHHQVHARHPDLPDVLMLDVLFTDLSGDTWHYRRDPRLTCPLAQARQIGPSGLPYLAPELALLFKARTAGGDPRGKDEQDFRRALPTLSTDARRWLRQALDTTSPGHPWRASLA